ncbi:MAG: restriction endonuclease subunit S [Chloroflexi bacterium]|nr:restriction endonuclease subunit S [Chloroflexota bacterium]
MSDQIAANWSKKTIGDLADVVSGGTPARDVPAFWEQGTIPWVTPTDITGTSGRYLDESADKITGLGLASSGANMLPTGTVLMTSRATVGEAKIAAVPCCTNQGFKSLVPKRDVDSLFLYYLTQFHKEGIKVLGSGSTFLEVGKADILRFPVTVPDYAQQKIISRILDSVDGAIEITESLIAKYQQIKTGLMHDLFTRGISKAGILRPIYSDDPEQYSHTEAGVIPCDWTTALVGELADYHNGNSFKSSDWNNEGYPIIRIQNLNNEESFNYYCGPLAEEWTVRSGDLLFAWAGMRETSFGPRVWMGPTAVLNQHIFKVVPRKSVVASSKYLFYLLSHYLPEIVNEAHGFKDSFVHITRKELTRVVVGIPSVEEQEWIANILDGMDQRIASEVGSLNKLRKQKAGLSHDLLSGHCSLTAAIPGKAVKEAQDMEAH